MPPPVVEGALTPRGLQIPAAALRERLGGEAGLRRLLRALTVRERPQPGRPKAQATKKREAFRFEGGSLYVPRAKAPALIGRGILGGAAAGPPPAAPPRELGGEAWAPAAPLYGYQEAAARHVSEGPLAPGGAGAAYLVMGTGLGKTRLGLAVAARGGGPAFVVVPTDSIRAQWLEEARAVYPGLRGGSYENPPRGSRRAAPTAATHDLVVGITNTVRAKPPGFFAGYATVVLDEANELCSPVNIRVLWLAQEAPRLLGITATPAERPDGLDRVVSLFLGDPIEAERDVPGFDVAGVRFRGRVREVEYRGPPDFCEPVVGAAGTVSAVETVGRLVADPARLRLVAAEVERLARLHETEGPAGLAALGLGPRPPGAAAPGRPPGGVRAHGVFVFAELREYLPALRAALAERLPPGAVEVPEEDGGGPVVLRGGASAAQLGAARRARVVLTTYGYSRRGVSIVDMTAIVLATPRRHGMQQILGRITRRGSDESILRLVVDIKDVCSPLKGQSAERRKVYRLKEYPIFRVRVGHPELGAAFAAPPTRDEEPVWAPGPGGGPPPPDFAGFAQPAEGGPGGGGGG